MCVCVSVCVCAMWCVVCVGGWLSVLGCNDCAVFDLLCNVSESHLCKTIELLCAIFHGRLRLNECQRRRLE